MDTKIVYSIPKEDAQKILQYLVRKPYAEVYELVTLLAGLQPLNIEATDTLVVPISPQEDS